MIITDANAFVGDLHDRMPVVLEEDQFAPWLAGAAGTELLKPAADDVLQRWPVSKRVNSSRADAEDATLIDPVAIEPDRTAQPDLFAP
jgi:putative SOS response-associated peptidase YedK